MAIVEHLAESFFMLANYTWQPVNVTQAAMRRTPKAYGFMIQNELLSILRCPENHSVLRQADDAVLSHVNAAIRSGRLRNSAGRVVEHVIDGGLVRAAGDLLYPIVDQIPVLLQDEAIRLDQLPH